MSDLIKNAFEKIQADKIMKTSVQDKVIKRMNKKSSYIRPAKWMISIACMILFLVSGIGGYDVYYTEAAAVSIDMNSSIEISINRFGRVVNTKSFDKESEEILKTVSLNHLPYEEAIETLLSAPSIAQYLTDGTVVNVTLVTDEENEQNWLTELEDCVNQALSTHHSGVVAEYGCTTPTVRQKAHHQGMSMGKYCAIQEIMEEEDGASLEEFQDMSMDEISSHKNSCGHHGR